MRRVEEEQGKICEYYIQSLEEKEVKAILSSDEKLNTQNYHEETLESFKGKSWRFLGTGSKSLKTRIENLHNTIPLPDTDYFEVHGGFQPAVKDIKLFSITDAEFQTLQPEEQEIVFPAVPEANQMKRYSLKSFGRQKIEIIFLLIKGR